MILSVKIPAIPTQPAGIRKNTGFQNINCNVHCSVPIRQEATLKVFDYESPNYHCDF